MANAEYANSRLATQLVINIMNQDSTSQLKNAGKNIIRARDKHHNITLQQVREMINQEQLIENALSKMKGASSWLTTLPLKLKNLSKRKFYDALNLRYRWTPKYLPSICPCGKIFDVEYALSCMRGRFVRRRHNDVRDMFAYLLKDVCYDVQVKPQLETLTGEVLPRSTNTADEARLDVSARGF